MCPAESGDDSKPGRTVEPDFADASTARPSFLVVDDDPFMLAAVQARMLRTMGHELVVTAPGGEVALGILAERPKDFDLIICDINMPGMDGIEFLQVVDAGPFRGHVILLSGEGIRIMRAVQKLLAGGRLVVLGSLEKPARRAPLNALIEGWRPLGTDLPERSTLPITGADLETAQRELQWLLHYQPKVDLKTGGVVGVEALLRWNRPAEGLIHPEAFLGLAEESGAIDALTEWVLHEALAQAAFWRKQGMAMQMSINLSMHSLSVPGFAQRIGELARSAGVAPQDVMLEISERRLVREGGVPLESLVRLRLQRFGLSIDDFGTGYSSLVQLRDVPFTELKVDGGFVCGSSSNLAIRPILEGCIGIAKGMGMLAVAEGVESEDDWHLLRSIGCDLAQGEFISPPMVPAQLPDWLAGWRLRLARLVGP